MIKVGKIWIFLYTIDIILFIFYLKRLFCLCSTFFIVFSVTYTICDGLKLDT